MYLPPIYISKKGGTIKCITNERDFIYLVCFKHLRLFSDDLIDAKNKLNKLESLTNKSTRISFHSMKRKGESLRILVEKAAKPYLNN